MDPATNGPLSWLPVEMLNVFSSIKFGKERVDEKSLDDTEAKYFLLKYKNLTLIMAVICHSKYFEGIPIGTESSTTHSVGCIQETADDPTVIWKVFMPTDWVRKYVKNYSRGFYLRKKTHLKPMPTLHQLSELVIYLQMHCLL